MFVKGETGNLKGRPVERKSLRNLCDEAFQEFDYIDALGVLKKAMDEREPWAFESFFKDIININNQRTIKVEIDKNNPDVADAIVSGILKGIGRLKTVTFDEACQLLGVLAQFRLAEVLKSNVKLSQVNEK